MTSTLAYRERLVLERLRETYERKGYEFFPEPSGDLLPAFLHGYRPDAMALKTGEGIIIEVRFGNHPDRDRRLESISALLAGQSGWHLKVYGEQPRPADALAIDVPTWQQIDAWINESERLAADGHERAALLVAWSVLEAVARTRASEHGLAAPRPFSPVGTIQALEMGGFLDDRAALELRETAQLRNRVAHGDFSIDVDRMAVDRLIGRLRVLAPSAQAPEPGPAVSAPVHAGN